MKTPISFVIMAGLVSIPAVAQTQEGAQTPPPVSTKPLGLTQDAWNAKLRSRGESRVNPGYVRYIYNPANVFPVRTRESMITTIKLPEDEKLKQAFAGDDQGFQVGIATPNTIAIKALYPGVDTNLVAFTEEGKVYTFYIRSEGYNSKTISDFLVDVINPAAGAFEGGSITSEKQLERDAMHPAETAERVRDPYASLTPDRRAKYREYAEWSDFRPGTVVEDLGVYVPAKSAGGSIPYRIFRDDRFTYVDYGPNATQMTEWPSPLIVVQGVEGPVGFRTAGPGGRMLVMEALGEFVLRNGQRMIIIKSKGRGDKDLIEYPVASSGDMAIPSDLPPGRPGALTYAPKTVVPTNLPATQHGEAPSKVVDLPMTREVRKEKDRRPERAGTVTVVKEIPAPSPAAPVRTVVGTAVSNAAANTPGVQTKTASGAPEPARTVGEVGLSVAGAALRPMDGVTALEGFKVVTGSGTPEQMADRWKSYRVQYYAALNGKRMTVETAPNGSAAMAIYPIATISEGMRLCAALGSDAANCTVKSAKGVR